MLKRRLRLAEAIELEDSTMEITVELPDGDITDEIRGRWREHSMIQSVSVRANDDPSFTTIIVPFGARSDLGTDSLIEELGSMIPRR